MRHVLTGALGAAVVYPAVWYGMAVEGPAPAAGAPQRAVATATRPVASREQARPAAAPELRGPAWGPASTERAAAEPAAAERPTLEELPAALGAPIEPPRPDLPALSEPGAPSPVFSDLRDTMGKMSDLQAHAHDPQELERRVQAMEQDPQQLARLKAMAEMFVQLPPSRLEPYLPSGEAASSSTRGR